MKSCALFPAPKSNGNLLGVWRVFLDELIRSRGACNPWPPPCSRIKEEPFINIPTFEWWTTIISRNLYVSIDVRDTDQARKKEREKENATAFINLVTMKTNRILHYTHNLSTMVPFWEKRRGMESFVCVYVFLGNLVLCPQFVLFFLSIYKFI